MYIPKRKEVLPMPPHVLQARGNLMWSSLALGSFFGICCLAVYNYANNRSREAAAARRLNGPKVAIIGGGVAGSTAAASLTQYLPEVQVTVFEPSREHCFYAMVPLAAAGHRSYDLRCTGPNTLYSSPAWTVTRDAELIPTSVKKIDPVAKVITDEKGVRHEYDVLVMACGTEYDFSRVKGLSRDQYDKSGIVYTPGSIRDGVCSTHQGNVIVARVPWASEYARPHDGSYIGISNTLWKFLQYFGRLGSCTTVQLHVATSDDGPSPFLSERHTDAIMAHWKEREVNFMRKCEIVEVDVKKRLATFVRNGDPKQRVTMPYRLLVLDVPRKAPAVIAENGLSAPGSDGFVDVDPETLQHRKFPSIFAIGDCAALPVAKSYSSIYAQAPVVSHNIGQLLAHREPNAKYTGYSSFNITMTTWRAMWPECIAPHYLKLQLARDPTATAESVIRANTGHLWNDADWKLWKGLLQGFYMQSTAYEFMHWLLFSRAWFYSPHWFSSPDFPEGSMLPDDLPRVTASRLTKSETL